jgi:hypothetical protein
MIPHFVKVWHPGLISRAKDPNATTADIVITDRSPSRDPDRHGVFPPPKTTDPVTFQKVVVLTAERDFIRTPFQVTGINMVPGSVNGTAVEVRMDPHT